MHRTLQFAIAGTVVAIGTTLAIPAAAQDIPKRKSGLWEFNRYDMMNAYKK